MQQQYDRFDILAKRRLTEISEPTEKLLEDRSTMNLLQIKMSLGDFHSPHLNGESISILLRPEGAIYTLKPDQPKLTQHIFIIQMERTFPPLSAQEISPAANFRLYSRTVYVFSPAS